MKRESIIHPLARELTEASVDVGMPATRYEHGLSLGPAVVSRVCRNRNGAIWRIYVTYSNPSSDHLIEACVSLTANPAREVRCRQLIANIESAMLKRNARGLPPSEKLERELAWANAQLALAAVRFEAQRILVGVAEPRDARVEEMRQKHMERTDAERRARLLARAH